MSTKTHPKVAVVTPIHNGKEHTLAYLESFNKIDYPNYVIIIVDDGSTDGSAEAIKKQFPNTVILSGDGNLWWSGATNLGVEEAKRLGADYVYTVNNDVTVDRKVLTSLVKCAQDNPIALVGCKIYYINAPDKVWYFGANLNDQIADIEIYNGDDADFQERRKVSVLTGMGVLIPIGVFEKTGLYDVKNMPQYFADSDFALRAGNAGYICMVDPDSKIYSDVESSWVNNQLKDPTLKFLWQCFTAPRSPYSVKIRYVFYRRHWGRHWLRILLRFYRKFIVSFVIRGFIPAYARKRLPFLKPILKPIAQRLRRRTKA